INWVSRDPKGSASGALATGCADAWSVRIASFLTAIPGQGVERTQKRFLAVFGKTWQFEHRINDGSEIVEHIFNAAASIQFGLDEFVGAIEGLRRLECRAGGFQSDHGKALNCQVWHGIEPTSHMPLPAGERPPSRASEMAGEGSCNSNQAPHPVCSLRSQTTLSPTGRGSEKAAGSM